MRKIFTVVVLLWIFMTGVAQDSLKTNVLSEIIYSVNRMDETLFSVPRSASIITSSQIEKSIFNSVGELLSAEAGLFIPGSNQTPGSNQAVFMRGANSNHTAVLIDGKRINDPSSPNAAIDLSEISLTNVERVEIIRGSHTTTYGGSAIGGVINIITKKDHQKGFHGNASAQVGTYGKGTSLFTSQSDLMYSFDNGLYFNGSLWDQRTSGLDATVKNDNTGFTSNDSDDFRKRDMAIKAGYNRNRVEGYAAYKRTNQRADIDNGSFTDDDNNYVSFRRNLFDYQAKYGLNKKLSVLTLGAITDSERFNENDSSAIDAAGTTDRSYFEGSYKGLLNTHEVQFNYTGQKISAVAGGGIFHDRMNFNTYYYSNAFGFPFELTTDYDSLNTSSSTTYIFGKSTYRISDLSVTGGARFSDHSLFGSSFTFEVSPSLELKNSVIYGSVSTGFNAPSLYQIYDPSRNYGAFTTRGNRELDAEESVSLELGLKHALGGGSSVTFSAYRTTVKNTIEYIYLWEGSTAKEDLDYTHYRGDTYINASLQQVTGFELTGAFRIHPKLFLNANISGLKGKITVDENDIDREHTGNNHIQLYNYGLFLSEKFDSDNLSRRPRFLANAQLTYTPFDKLGLTASYRHAGSRFDPAYDPSMGPFGALSEKKISYYSLADASVSFRFSRSFSIFAKAENVLDEKYAEIQGYRTRGRSFYLKLLFNW